MEVLEKQIKIPATTDADYLHLYEKLFPVCAKWVRSMNGSLDDAEDIFQDALIIYFEKKETTIPMSPEAYILGITKHLWIRKFEKRKSIVSLTDLERTLTIPEDFFPSIH